jgi:hypothetical protein
MASAWYPAGLAMAVKAGNDLDAAGVKMALVKTALSYNAAHDAYDDISANVVGTPIALTSITWVASSNVLTFDAADTGLTWSSVAAGDTIGAVVVYNDSGTPSTSYLLTFNDVTDTPTNGGNITITIHGSGIGTITC